MHGVPLFEILHKQHFSILYANFPSLKYYLKNL
jgi:hypothetical protein